MPRDIVTLFAQKKGNELIQKHCQNISFPVASLRELTETIVDMSTMQRRRGLNDALEEILLDSMDGEDA